MHLIYNYGDLKTAHYTDKAALMLTNNIGSYAIIPTYNFSRYQGIVYCDSFRMFKIVDSVSLLNSGKLENSHYNFFEIENEYDLAREKYFMPNNTNAVVYELNMEGEIEIVFDVKELYDNREFGKSYDIWQEDGKIIVKFTKKTDSREDRSNNRTEYEIYAVIIPDRMEFSVIGEWIKKEYEYDKKRKSMPFERYVYRALKLKCSRFVMAFSKDREKAFAEADFVNKNIEALKKEKMQFKFTDSLSTNEKNTQMAYLCAQNSINELTNIIDSVPGIYAGLPWFFQFWSRDELVSLKALMIGKRYGFARKVLFKHLSNISDDGRLPNIYPAPEKFPKTSADSAGWLFFRMNDYLEALKDKKQLGLKSTKTALQEMKIKLDECIYKLNENYGKKGFIYSKEKETWMDTVFKDDTRKGARLEIQVLYLFMQKLKQNISELMGDKSWAAIADANQKHMAVKIKKEFWTGWYLKDGIDDATIRPNIFIAYYLYPSLLTDKEWEQCFDTALSALWLEWGGLSSIDKMNPLFFMEHTGEDSRSYHRGDSWYWINNLAAICMLRLNSLKYKRYITNIVQASVHDILWQGIAGQHSEISSARVQEPFGCFAQAWSSAMFIELIHELYGKK